MAGTAPGREALPGTLTVGAASPRVVSPSRSAQVSGETKLSDCDTVVCDVRYRRICEVSFP